MRIFINLAKFRYLTFLKLDTVRISLNNLLRFAVSGLPKQSTEERRIYGSSNVNGHVKHHLKTEFSVDTSSPIFSPIVASN